MKTNLKAQMGNALVTFFAWFVKFNPMWAYRFTELSNIHADKYLLGKDKEIKLIKKLLEKGVETSEIRSHLWSADTVLATLQDNKLAPIFAGNFVDYAPAKSQFDAVLQSKNPTAIKAACGQNKHTPSEQFILKIAVDVYPYPNDPTMTRPDNMEAIKLLVKHHNGAFTASLLNKFEASLQTLFLQLAADANKATAEQVEWALKHSERSKAREFINQFFHNIPTTSDAAHMLRAYSGVLFDTWCRTQTAATLCKCCLNSWAKEGNEQYLRLIEEKAFIHNDSDSAIQLVRSTNKFVFQNALICILQQNAAAAFLLPCVDKENELYPKMVHQILNSSNKINHLTENQVTQLSAEQRNLYWKNMALCNYISAQQYANLPDGELKQEVAKIMEDNAMIAWFQKNQDVTPSTIAEFGDKELSNRVQYWLAKNSYLTWLVYYFSGLQANDASKIAFGWDIKISSNKSIKPLSINAFQKLVNDNREKVLKAYLYVHKAILPAQREYLLCSPLKHLAVGVNVI